MLRVVLVAPQIPGNAGAAARLCLSFGAELHLVEPLGFSMSEKAVRRSGMDYIRHMEIGLWKDFDEYREKCCDDGHQFVGFSKFAPLLWGSEECSAQMRQQCQEASGVSLVLGSESKGLYSLLPDSTVEDMLMVRVPIESPAHRAAHNDTGSLNLGTSVAIALWEVKRGDRPLL